jgi:hypothetical protein
MTFCKEMKTRIIAIAIFVALGMHTRGEEVPPMKSLRMNVVEVYEFIVSLMELREDTQHKRFDKNELQVISDALGSAQFLKKIEHEDVARTPYISRYQFSHGFLGGTPRTGETESGMLTMDCRTFYWEEGIFEIDAENAAKLKKLFPQPRNALTKTELPAMLAEEKKQNKSEQATPRKPSD